MNNRVKINQFQIRKGWLVILCMVFFLVLFSGKSMQAKENETYSFGHFYYHSHGGYVSICGYLGREAEVVIPSSIAGKPVSEIESKSFNKCNTIEVISVPDTVVLVYEDSFTGALSLKKIVSDTIGVAIKAGDGVVIEYTSDQEHADLNTDNGGNSNTTGNESQTKNTDEGSDTTKKTDARTDTTEKTIADENTDVSADTEIGDFAYEDAGEEYTERGISIPDSNLILTVDENGNLVEIDLDGNAVILDKSKKYTFSENSDGVICINDEDGNEAKVIDDGNIEFVSPAQKSTDSKDTDASGKKEGGLFTIVVSVMAVLVIFAIICVLLGRKKRGKRL